MSYRAFKRLLGETSLERKCRFLLGAGILLLITASFWLYAYQTEHLAYDQTTTTCRVAGSVLRSESCTVTKMSPFPIPNCDLGVPLVFEKKVEAESRKLFATLKDEAKPVLFLKKKVSAEELKRDVETELKQAGGIEKKD